MKTREQMNIVVVGHVDHGKSTVIGRLLADTYSLPQGKLEQVKAQCEKNARPFEYAFLLDALKDEQSQGITIDTARCFFKTDKRDYIIFDAPGHVEFLKNMISGAARAEAAVLVIDAKEGIQENSRRHGYLIAMLGIKQIVVAVNKMDLVNYSQEIYYLIIDQYRNFLETLGVKPIAFLPICAISGENIVLRSKNMKWYSGSILIEYIDSFTKQEDIIHKPFRMPVQDIYKFTENGDDRRIIAGTIESGKISIGDDIVFMPSGKKSTIVSIEDFPCSLKKSVSAGYAVGFTIKDELYIPRGEVMCRVGEELPFINKRIKVRIFWMGRVSMIKNKKYKLKIASTRVNVQLVEILLSIDANDLSNRKDKQQIDRYDVAECILETARPIAFENIDNVSSLGRFVIVDNYDIVGGGIIIEDLKDNQSLMDNYIKQRENNWDKGFVTQEDRYQLFGHKSKFIVITGSNQSRKVAKLLEQNLIKGRNAAYYLGVSSLEVGLDTDVIDEREKNEENIRRLGELARILTDAGLIFITAFDNIDEYDIELLARLTAPNEFLHVSLTGNCDSGDNKLSFEDGVKIETIVNMILKKLAKEEIIPEYII